MKTKPRAAEQNWYEFDANEKRAPNNNENGSGRTCERILFVH